MTNVDAASYPYGVDVYTHTEVIPKPAPDEVTTWTWRIGPVTDKTHENTPQRSAIPATRLHIEGITTVQLLATQQVQLTISGADKYGNPVDITGDTTWESSDTTILTVENVSLDNTSCMAVTTGQVGSAAITVTNDVNKDGTGDFIGSLAIDVVAGPMAEIEVSAGTPTDKPA
jgi:hypothetical protein